MTKEMDEDEFGEAGDAMLVKPPYWLFEISVSGVPRGRVFGDTHHRNWVLWRLSKYAIEFEDQGIVSVKRYTNGKWEIANDWRNLAH